MFISTHTLISKSILDNIDKNKIFLVNEKHFIYGNIKPDLSSKYFFKKHYLKESYEMIEVGTEVPENADFGIKISGDSMLPRFLDKQIVWVQKTNYIENGEFGIFFLDGNSYIKKFQDIPGNVALLSLNPAYAPIPVKEGSTFKIFGRVVG